jgi:anti-sigma factor RsiW
MAIEPENERQAELVAYLDGELDERAAQEFEGRLGRDAQLRAEADELIRVWELLEFLPRPEASQTFTTRTLDKLAVLRPSASQTTAAKTIVGLPAESRTRLWPWVAGFAAAAALLFLAAFSLSGALGRKAPPPDDSKVVEELMAKDLRVLDNLALYQYGDDLAFVLGLDEPELFGEEAGR